MNADLWMIIAIVEFVVIIILIRSNTASPIVETAVKIQEKIDKKKERIGTIRLKKVEFKGFQASKVTIFEIQEEGKEITYAAIDGEVDDLEKGYVIEFLLSDESIASTNIDRKSEKDGKVTRWTDKRYYYQILSYKVIMIEDRTMNEELTNKYSTKR